MALLWHPGIPPRICRNHRVVFGQRVAVGHPGEVVGYRAQEERLSRVARSDLGVEALQRHVPQVRDAREIAIPEEHVIREESRVPVPGPEERRDDELRAPIVLRDAVAMDHVLIDEFLELPVEALARLRRSHAVSYT